MQNRTDSGIPCFSTPQPNMDVPLNDIEIKVHKYTKYEIKVQNFSRICGLVSNILIFLQLYVLTSEIKVINYRNQNMAFLLNAIA